jgi:hypothetical protein
MSRLGINTGSSPNDGQGDPLRIAMGKINSNFTEIYNTIGDGNNLISYASTAGISTLARNLTGSPRINVSGILNTGITTTEHIEVRNITSTGVVTATQFVGDGSQLTNVTALVGGLEVLDDNVRKGVARELNFGDNIVSTGPDGVGRVTISVASSITVTGIVTTALYADSSGVSGVSTYANTAGISTVAQGLTGTPNLNVGVVTATQFIGDGSLLTNVPGSTNSGYANTAGIATVAQGLTGTPSIDVYRVGVTSSINVGAASTFQKSVHFESTLLIGDTDELQIFHDGNNSYIDNASPGNLILRDSGTGIQLKKTSGALMGVFNNDAGVELYYDSVLKFQTFQNGVAINDSVGIGTTAGNPPYRLTVSGIGATITQGLVNAIADFTSSVNGYGQLNVRNSLSGTNASGDIVVTTDTGTDTSNFIDLGINNTGFTTTSWTINGALDGYLYTSDGNLSIGAASASKYLSLFAGGTLAENEQVRVTNTGVGIGTTNVTSKLTVGGDVRVSGVITATSYIGSASSLTGLTGASANTYGNATSVPQIVVDSNGRISSIANVLISGGGGGGTSIIVNDDNSLVGSAGTINFGTGISVTPESVGIVTVNVSYSPIAGYSTSAGIATSAGISTSVIGGVGIITQLSVSAITTTANLNVTGIGTFLTTGLKVRNSANTFQYNITSGAITADRTLNLPVITATDTLAVLGLSQTFTAVQSFSNTLTASATLDLTGNTTGTHVFGSNQTSGTITLGGSSGTGAITFGRSTVSQTTDIQAGVTASGSTKTINLGTNGASGSFTRISVGPTAGVGTVIINSGSNLGIGSTLPTSNIDVVGSGKFTGIVTASRFDSVTAGTPIIESTDTISINTPRVAISTDLTIGGNTGIGTTIATSRLTVVGDARIGINTSQGVILTSPNGTKYRLIVDDSGVLSTVLVP